MWSRCATLAIPFRTQHRIAEAKVYGPFHSLDATMKPPVDEGKDSDRDTPSHSKKNRNKKGSLSSRRNSGSLNSTETSTDGLSNGRGQQNRSGPRVPEIELNGPKESGITSGKFTPAEKSRGGGLRGRNSNKGVNRHPGAPNDGAPGDFEEPLIARVRI